MARAPRRQPGFELRNRRRRPGPPGPGVRVGFFPAGHGCASRPARGCPGPGLSTFPFTPTKVPFSGTGWAQQSFTGQERSPKRPLREVFPRFTTRAARPPAPAGKLPGAESRFGVPTICRNQARAGLGVLRPASDGRSFTHHNDQYFRPQLRRRCRHRYAGGFGYFISG
jgi:hypothetical protein